MAEGVGALGFSQPIKSSAESIAKQVAAQTRRQQVLAGQQMRAIQRAEEKKAANVAKLEDRVVALKADLPYFQSELGGEFQGKIVELTDKMFEYIETNEKAPNQLRAEFAQVTSAGKGFATDNYRALQGLTSNKKYIDEFELRNIYFNEQYASGDMFKPNTTSIANFYQSGMTDEQRFRVIDKDLFWSDFFKGVPRTTESLKAEQNGMTQTEGSTLSAFVKVSPNNSVIAKGTEEMLASTPSGMSLLQQVTGNGTNQETMALLNNRAAKILEGMDDADIISASFDGKPISVTAGKLKMDPNHIMHTYLQAQALSETVSQYGLGNMRAVSSSIPVAGKNESEKFDESNSTYIKTIYKVSDVVRGRVPSDAKQGLVEVDGKLTLSYDVSSLFPNIKLVDMEKAAFVKYLPEYDKFLMKEKKTKLIDLSLKEENLLDPYNFVKSAEFSDGYSAIQAEKVMTKKGVSGETEETFDAAILTHVADDDIKELSYDTSTLVNQINEKLKGINAEQLDSKEYVTRIGELIREYESPIPTSLGLIKTIRDSRGDIIVSFTNGQTRSFDSIEEAKAALTPAVSLSFSGGTESSAVIDEELLSRLRNLV